MKAQTNDVRAQISIPSEIYAGIKFEVASKRAAGNKITQSEYLSNCLRAGYKILSNSKKRKP